MAARLSFCEVEASTSHALEERPCIRARGGQRKTQKHVNWKPMQRGMECDLALGKKTHPDGSQYVGTLANGLPHGRGRFTFKNGGEYVGDYQHGKKHGQGTLSYPDSSKYDGFFRDGLKHGPGVMRFADGSTYEGDFSIGEMEGMGTFTWPAGIIFTGAWKAGKRHGTGTMFHADGTTAYTSHWRQNLRVSFSGETSPTRAEAAPAPKVPILAETLCDDDNEYDGSRKRKLEEESETAERLIQMRVGFFPNDAALL